MTGRGITPQLFIADEATPLPAKVGDLYRDERVAAGWRSVAGWSLLELSAAYVRHYGPCTCAELLHRTADRCLRHPAARITHR